MALIDNFTESSAVNLLSHTGDSGHTWARVTGAPAGVVTVGAGTGKITGEATSGIFYSSDVPASANYDVEIVFNQSSSTVGFVGVIGRCSTSAYTFYQAFLSSSGSLFFSKIYSRNAYCTYK